MYPRYDPVRGVICASMADPHLRIRKGADRESEAHACPGRGTRTTVVAVVFAYKLYALP